MNQKTFKTLRYSNITVSGAICTGSTTLSHQLKEVLGWRYHSTGELYRKFVKEQGIKLEHTKKSPDDIHRQLDSYVIDHLKTLSHQIFEGWLTGYMAEGIEGVLKILLICSEDAIRIDRFANRENVTIEEAKDQIRIREKENLEKWQALYNTRNFWNPERYNMVIDSYSHSKEEILRLVLKKLGYEK